MDAGRRRIDTIVLAAGAGRRFETSAPKPLAVVNGRPMVVSTIDRLRQGGAQRVIVVVGYGAGAVREAVEQAFPKHLDSFSFVENEAFTAGLASSLRAAIDAVNPASIGSLIHHADRPFVKPETVGQVLALAREGVRAVVPRFRRHPGFPVYLSVELLAAIRPTLQGDQGARRYLRAHEEDVTYLDVEDRGVVEDVDTQADLERSSM